MAVHLTLGGKWVTCNATVRACPREYHLNASVEEAQRTPRPFLDQLFGIAQRDAQVASDGSVAWHDEKGRTHRDYDEPAYVRGDGNHREWWSHGERHRGGDKPAVDTAAGYKAWYRKGLLHRTGGKPAVVYPNGNLEYWVNGRKLGTGPITTV